MDQGREELDWEPALEEEDTEERLNEILASAEGGDSASQYQLAVSYYQGTQDLEPDHEQGWPWLEKAAENGSVKAQKVAGLLCMNGQYTPWPEKSPEKAVGWYYKAAEQEDGEAAYWLGTCLLQGIGVAQDTEKGNLWIEAAAVLGYGEEDEGATGEENSQPPSPPPVEPSETDGGTPDAEDRTPAKVPTASRRPANRKGTGRVYTPRHDLSYCKNGLLFGLFALAGAIILCCLTALIVVLVNSTFFSAPAHSQTFFWCSVVVCLVAAGLAFGMGYGKAYQMQKKNAWFRKTPFYKQYLTDLHSMDSNRRLQYDVYSALERTYRPCSWQDTISRLTFREYKGYMYPGVIFSDGKSKVRPDLVVMTEKAVYVLDCCHASGTIRGERHSKEWQIVKESGKTRTIPNLVAKNEMRIHIMQENLNKICPWVALSKIPFHSLILFGPEADIGGISVPKNKYIHVFSGGRDKIRGYLEVLESRGSLHAQDMAELVKAVEKIAHELPARRKQSE